MSDYYKGYAKGRYGGCPVRLAFKIKGELWKSSTSAKAARYSSPCQTNRSSHDVSLEERKYAEAGRYGATYDL